MRALLSTAAGAPETLRLNTVAKPGPPARHAAAVGDSHGFYAAGVIKPKVSQVCAPEDVAQALVLLGTRKSTGKLVVTAA